MYFVGLDKWYTKWCISSNDWKTRLSQNLRHLNSQTRKPNPNYIVWACARVPEFPKDNVQTKRKDDLEIRECGDDDNHDKLQVKNLHNSNKDRAGTVGGALGTRCKPHGELDRVSWNFPFSFKKFGFICDCDDKRYKRALEVSLTCLHFTLCKLQAMSIPFRSHHSVSIHICFGKTSTSVYSGGLWNNESSFACGNPTLWIWFN